MPHTPIGRLRTMGFIEGMSLLILLFIAMPLKYWAGLPLAVTIVGSVHGGLFILYLLVLAYATFCQMAAEMVSQLASSPLSSHSEIFCTTAD